MTRTADGVQAEIDALRGASEERIGRDNAYADTLPDDRHEEAAAVLNASLRLALQESRQIKALEAERDRLARKELDVATPSDVRDLALRLRDAYRFSGAYVVGAEESWESLGTAEAAAWAAVAREAQR